MEQQKDLNHGRKLIHSIRSEMSYMGTYLYQSKKRLNEFEEHKMYDVAESSYDKIKQMVDELGKLIKSHCNIT